MTDKYVTCLGCPDRRPGCHGECDGYQAREQEKAIRYDLRAKTIASFPTREAYEKRRRRNQRLTQRGQMSR